MTRQLVIIPFDATARPLTRKTAMERLRAALPAHIDFVLVPGMTGNAITLETPDPPPRIGR